MSTALGQRLTERERRTPHGWQHPGRCSLYSVLRYGVVCSEALTPDSTKEGPLCMNQFARLYGHVRVPEKGRDKLVSGAAGAQIHPVVGAVTLPS